MGVELVWLLIPVLGLVVIAAFIATVVIVCRRRCKKDDEDDTSSDVELQERDKQEDSVVGDGDPYNSDDVSFRRPEEDTVKKDSIRVTSRRLPDLPVEGQTQEEEAAPPVPPPPPPPPPDVVSGGAEIRRDDAGTYAMLGADQAPLIDTDPDMEGPYAEGRGLSYPSPDLGGPTHTPPQVPMRDKEETGEDRNAVYSVINQLEKQKSRKLRLQKEEEEGIRASVAD